MVNDLTQPKVPEASQPIKNSIKKVSNKTLDVIGIEFLIIVIISIAATLILNYFSILPLSQKFPKVFGFLPTKNSVTISSTINNTTSGKTDPNSVPGDFEQPSQYLFSCPIPKFCPESKTVYDKEERRNKGMGILYVDDGTIVQAVSAGEYEVKSIKEGITTIVLTKDDGTFEATYIFTGEPDQREIGKKIPVKNYQSIGKIKGPTQQLVEFSSQQYSLYIEFKDLRTDTIVPFVPVENANGLDLL